MTAPRSTEQLLEAFLADGLTQLPDRTYDAVRRDIHGLRQRGLSRARRLRGLRPGQWAGLAVAAPLALAVVALDLRPGGGPGAMPSPAPTESSAPSLAVSPAAESGESPSI